MPSHTSPGSRVPLQAAAHPEESTASHAGLHVSPAGFTKPRSTHEAPPKCVPSQASPGSLSAPSHFDAQSLESIVQRSVHTRPAGVE